MMAGQPARLRITAAMSARILSAGEPQRVRAVPPFSIRTIRTDGGSGALVRRGQLLECVIANGTESLEPTRLGFDRSLCPHLRAPLMIVPTVARRATERIGDLPHGIEGRSRGRFDLSRTALRIAFGLRHALRRAGRAGLRSRTRVEARR